MDSFELETLTRFIEKIKSEPVWAPLLVDIENAEILRRASLDGWRKLWNDVIARWSITTNKGSAVVKIPSVTDPTVLQILDIYQDILRSKFGSRIREEIHGNDVVRLSINTNSSDCKECQTHVESPVIPRAAATPRLVQENEVNNLRLFIMPPTIKKTSARIECAIAHLSNAIAFLSSNSARPTNMEIELAQGEFRVTTQQVNALELTDIYKECIAIVENMYFSPDTFSIDRLMNILQKLMDIYSK